MALLHGSRLAMRARWRCTQAGRSGSLETAGALLRGMHELGLPCFELEPANLRMLTSLDDELEKIAVKQAAQDAKIDAQVRTPLPCARHRTPLPFRRGNSLD